VNHHGDLLSLLSLLWNHFLGHPGNSRLFLAVFGGFGVIGSCMLPAQLFALPLLFCCEKISSTMQKPVRFCADYTSGNAAGWFNTQVCA
jgi:hypothetical protein